MATTIDRRPNWVTDSRTPQELIDDAYNVYLPVNQWYFKPPETEEEQATYAEHRDAWWLVQSQLARILELLL